MGGDAANVPTEKDTGEPSRTRSAPFSRNEINLRWLVRLRWGAVAGQAFMVLAAWLVLDIDLPLAILFGLIALGAASNLVAALWLAGERPVPEALLVGLMALDMLVLSGLLAVSGGPANPFSTLYLVNIALAAVVLRSAWAWGLTAIAVSCFGALFVIPFRVDGDAHLAHGTDHLGLHLEGMWVAFGVCAVFIVYFVQRVTSELARRDRELADARTARTRVEQLASLATLAAGAAHELSTPLATIAVIARELERSALATGNATGTLGDLRLIRAQLDRCRAILDRMAGEAGEAPGETLVDVTVADLLETATRDLAPNHRLDIQIERSGGAPEVRVPRRAVQQALAALTKNALEASKEGVVAIRAHPEADEWCIEIEDRGSGMSEDVLSRLGEPFFSTKGPGAGMGLGVFIARTVLIRLGGRLDFSSQPEAGTTVHVRLPADVRLSAMPGTHA